MLRTARTRSMRLTATLLHSLLTGSAILAGSVIAASTLTACADESKPDYWIEKLEQREWRSKAIERLTNFYEDALTNAKKNPENAEVKALLGQIAEPLTQVYVNEYVQLDEKTREALINLLASFRDPRTLPALNKAFEEFGKSGRGGRDVKWASRAVRDMKSQEAAAALFAAFKKTKPSTPDGAYYRDLNEALLALKDPSWASDLIGILDTDFPFIPPGKKPTVDQQKDLRDAAYLAITSAQLLGEMKNESAVKPLMMVVLDPTRALASNDALLALTKIGKPAVDATVKLIKNQDKELAEYYAKQVQKATGATSPPTGNPHVEQAAKMLGAMGRSEGIAPVIEVLKSIEEDADKVPLLVALSQLPHTPEVKKAFMDAYSSLDSDASAGSAKAVTLLAEPATTFFDDSITRDIVNLGFKMKGNDDVTDKLLLTLAAIKTMGPGDVGRVGSLVKTLPKDKELAPQVDKIAHGYEVAKGVLDRCKKDVGCYIKEAGKTSNQSEKDQMAGVKALYMVGQLGKPADASALLESMPDLEKPSFRYLAAQVLDHMFPAGSSEVSAKLQELVDKNKNSMDSDKAAADKPLRDVLYRLEARG